jgi:CO/xanthine dehydrogenase FAD-binding subunit
MFPAPFVYVAPTTIDETLACLQQHGADAKLLAGGQSLVAAMNAGLARPGVIVDLNGVTALDGIRGDGGGLALGALTRQREIETSDAVRAACPLVAEAAALIGNPRVRNRGTLGGSLCHADPASELSAVMLALDAELRVANRRGTRAIAARNFFLGPLTTALAEDDVLVGVRVPALPAGSGWAFVEVARRPGDFAIAGAAVVLTLGEDGRCLDARLAFCGIGPVPTRAVAAEVVLRDARLDDVRIAQAARATRELDIEGDALVSADYRRQLVTVLATRAIDRALERRGVDGTRA